MGSQGTEKVLTINNKTLKNLDKSKNDNDPFLTYCAGIPIHSQTFAIDNMKLYYLNFINRI